MCRNVVTFVNFFLSVDYLAQVFDVLKTDLKDDVVSYLPDAEFDVQYTDK